MVRLELPRDCDGLRIQGCDYINIYSGVKPYGKLGIAKKSKNIVKLFIDKMLNRTRYYWATR